MRASLSRCSFIRCRWSYSMSSNESGWKSCFLIFPRPVGRTVWINATRPDASVNISMMYCESPYLMEWSTIALVLICMDRLILMFAHCHTPRPTKRHQYGKTGDTAAPKKHYYLTKLRKMRGLRKNYAIKFGRLGKNPYLCIRKMKPMVPSSIG